MDVFKWFRGRSEAARLEQGDVEALIHGYGYGAYCEACRRELDAGMLEMTSYRGSTSGPRREFVAKPLDSQAFSRLIFVKSG